MNNAEHLLFCNVFTAISTEKPNRKTVELTKKKSKKVVKEIDSSSVDDKKRHSQVSPKGLALFFFFCEDVHYSCYSYPVV